MSRITKKAPYGRHIRLTCVNHPELEWSTKNIGSIGQRSIFFNLDGDPSVRECDCPLGDLRVHPVYDDMPEVGE